MIPAPLVGLMRPRVSLAVAAGTLFGALYAGSTAPEILFLASAGSFSLCAGCSALNQLQERHRDKRMKRTRGRALPSGAIQKTEAGVLAAHLFALAAILWLLAGGWPMLVLGLAIVTIYNGLYTPLKPYSPMALLVGGLAGAMPPLTGWIAAGGDPLNPDILCITALFYLWQVPHFWLLAERHRDDYRRAGFALPSRTLPGRYYRLLLSFWVAMYFVALSGLVFLSGKSAFNWLIPPVVLLACGLAIREILTGQVHRVRIGLDVSLPAILLTILITANL